MKCELCGNEGTVDCQWGLYEREGSMNDAVLCGDCSRNLWLKCAGPVNAGMMHWTNRPVENHENSRA